MNAAAGDLAQRESGVLVPAHLAHVPEGAPVQDTTARNADGRRRVVLPREVRRTFTRMAHEMALRDVAFVLCCRTKRTSRKLATDVTTGAQVPVDVEELIPDACGELLLREGEGTHDPGFGCKCTRIHFTAFTS